MLGRTVCRVNRVATAGARAARVFSTEAPAPMILGEVKGNVGVITLNRPKALNALCDQLVKQLNTQLKVRPRDISIICDMREILSSFLAVK